MRVYDNKHWISVLLSLHKTDTLKTLASGMITMAMYAGLVVYLETEYFKMDKYFFDTYFVRFCPINAFGF